MHSDKNYVAVRCRLLCESLEVSSSYASSFAYFLVYAGNFYFAFSADCINREVA